MKFYMVKVLMVLLLICNSCDVTRETEPEPIFNPELDLLAYWPFRGNANDMSGNNAHGTINGALFVEDRFQKPFSAFYFDGSSFLKFDYSATLSNLYESTTFNLWLKGDDFDRSAKIINNGQTMFADPPNAGYSIRIVKRPMYQTVSGQTEIWFHLIDVNNKREQVGFPISELPLNKYFMLTAVFERKRDVSTMKIYLNEKLMDLKEVLFDRIETSQPISIGALYRYEHYLIDEYFKGVIDDVRIYKKALSDKEVTQLYSITK
ncbi:MAG: LamG domain-containing protein [Ignavibacteria bacterium]|nr:LamG domain-containing protein [Ignavibacteria bacterium]